MTKEQKREGQEERKEEEMTEEQKRELREARGIEVLQWKSKRPSLWKINKVQRHRELLERISNR